MYDFTDHIRRMKKFHGNDCAHCTAQEQIFNTLRSPLAVTCYVEHQLSQGLPQGWQWRRPLEGEMAAGTSANTWIIFEQGLPVTRGFGCGDRSYMLLASLDLEMFVFIHSNDSGGVYDWRKHGCHTGTVVKFSDLVFAGEHLGMFVAHLIARHEPNYYWPT